MSKSKLTYNEERKKRTLDKLVDYKRISFRSKSITSAREKSRVSEQTKKKIES